MKRLYLIVLFVLTPFAVRGQVGNEPFIRGADISFTPQIEDLGGKYKVNGVAKDALDILRENGVNYIRLRLWHTPTNGYCGLAKTLAYALRVKAKGLKLQLDFHYSDWWADPGKQNKPAAWANIPYAALKESVYTYTKEVIAAMKNQNTLPDMVQIGNEITSGMLWPDGRVGGSTDPTQSWKQLGELVRQGIQGAKDGAAGSPMRIMIHIDRGGDNAGSRWFFDNLIFQGVQFDVIGQSYYPWWHGTLNQLKNNLNDLSTRYNKDIVIAETAYPWTTQTLNDRMGNVGVDGTKLPPGYPMSPQGQKTFLATITKILKETPGKRGLGFIYWEPAYISVSPIGSSWEHLTTFDFGGEALNSITAFKDLDSLKSINVKVRINTSTLADTLKTTGVVQVRGEIVGAGSSLLPSGELLTWDASSQATTRNIGGDYWDCQFKMYQDDQLQFKFWAGHDINRPTNLRLGWEGPIAPYDGSGLNARLFKAGTRDTTLDIQFFNSAGTTVDQFWSPIQHRTDVIGVLFRVNLSSLLIRSIFDPAIHGPVVVRGDSTSSAGILSWTTNNIVLSQETTSVAANSFWSGVGYFPQRKISPGTRIRYKYFVVGSPFGGWESSINDRIFEFPQTDTTLMWQLFNDGRIVSAVEEHKPAMPGSPQLFQNYPNPFNPTTNFGFRISDFGFVSLKIFDVLGKEVATVVDQIHPPGVYTVRWDGSSLPSGVYFCRLTVNNAPTGHQPEPRVGASSPGFVQTRTLILLK